jgi:hypothetical protein
VNLTVAKGASKASIPASHTPGMLSILQLPELLPLVTLLEIFILTVDIFR